MKYARPFQLALLMILIGTGLFGCALNSERADWEYRDGQPVDLIATEQFLPLQARDETGRLLPYNPSPNPYTRLTGRIAKDAVTTYIVARRAFNAGDFQRAEQLLVELAEKEPDLSGPWVLRGDIALARSDPSQAQDHYINALELNSINFNAWLRLAKVQRMQGHFSRAQNTYAKALARWPDGPELHLNLGVLYDLYLNMPLKAQAHMEAYQLLTGGNQDVLAWLDEIRQRTGVIRALKTIGPEGQVESISTATDSEQDGSQSLAASKSTKE